MSQPAPKIEPGPGLLSCYTCADNLTCSLIPRRESMAGCQNWRCQVCRGPWWCASMAHDKCMETGVPNGIFYHDGGSMKPLSDATGHSYQGGYCLVHKSWRCGVTGD
jgi:hypothetical protein